MNERPKPAQPDACEWVRYVTDGPVAWVTLNRPDKLNAINAAMVEGLNRALDRAEADERVRVIVLSGEGRAFSAGFDLSASSDEAAARIAGQTAVEAVMRSELTADFNVIMRFWDSPKPTIAAVHGWCLGSAMEMAVACDITLATDDSRFGAPEVTFGSGIVALVLPWFCGPKKAKELLLTGTKRVTAEQAATWGLVNQVVPAHELRARAKELALEIASNDPLAVRLTKQAINDSLDIAGMRPALLSALETDIAIESTGPENSADGRSP